MANLLTVHYFLCPWLSHLMALIFSTCRVVKQLWDNGCEGLRSYLHGINLLLLSMSFSLSIMLFCRWCVRFVCSLYLPLCFSWYLPLPLPSSEGLFPAPWVWGPVSHIAHPCWLQEWAMIHGDPVKGLRRIPKQELKSSSSFILN